MRVMNVIKKKEDEKMKKELLRELLENKQYKQLHTLLMKESEVDIAYLLQQLELEDCAIAFRLLSKKQAAHVFSNLDFQRQKQLVELFSETEIASLVENQYMDDLVDLVEDLPANLVTRILNQASVSQRQTINQLLSYPSESAGALMTTEFLSLKKEMTLSETLNFIKEKGNHSKTVYTSYVCDNKKLIGVVSTKDLLLNDENKKVEGIMKDNFSYVYTHTDQEKVAQIFRKYDLMVLPVVDDEKMLVGIVTADDIMDVMVDETNEDISKMAALEPNDKTYFQASVFEHAKHRIIWLLVLMFSATVTGSIITKYENAFQVVPLLVSFIPMLMDTGGNCGSQSSTLIIRGIALDEIHFRDTFKVMFKEFRIALLVGSILALANGIRIFLMYQDVNISFVVALSLIVTVILSKLIGCILPLLANRIGLDPAIMASPLITTIVDTCLILVYFNIAMHIFNL